MGKDLIISQHALRSTLEQVAEKASEQQWRESQHNEPRESQMVDRVRSVMEAAAENPIALSIMARRLIYGESHRTAVQNVARVTTIPATSTASRMRVYRLKSILGG